MLLTFYVYVLFFGRGCRKGDYYRYLAEFRADDERKETADLSMKAYQVGNYVVLVLYAIGFEFEFVKVIIQYFIVGLY